MIALLALAVAFAAPVLSFEEHTQDGRTPSVDFAEGRTVVVDINSVVTVELERAALVAAIAELEGLSTPAIEMELQEVGAALAMAEQGIELADELADALEAFEGGGSSAGVAAALRRVAGFVPTLRPYLEADAALMEAFEDTLAQGLDESQQYAAFFELTGRVTRQRLQTATEALTEAIDTHGLRVVLGAWVGRGSSLHPVHVPGFDSFSPMAATPVDRFVFTLDDTQKRELQRYSRLAESINDRRDVAGERLRRALPRVLGRVAESFEHCETTVAVAARAIIDEGDDAPFDRMFQSMRELHDFFEVERGPARTGAELLIDTDSRLAAFAVHGRALARELETLEDARFPGVADGVVQASVEVFSTCRQELETLAAMAEDSLGEAVEAVLGGGEIEDAFMEFAQEVERHEAGNVPTRTEIDLQSAGPRRPGDTVVVRLAYEDPAGRITEVERHRLQMFRILVHADTVASLIFADAVCLKDCAGSELTAGEPVGDVKFEAAASYAVVLKAGSRRHVAWNRWLDFGVGVSMSALDFDDDDTPELGIAVVGTMFRDIVQVGFGIDVNTVDPYWQFGVRLPLPTFTLPTTSGGGGMGGGL